MMHKHIDSESVDNGKIKVSFLGIKVRLATLLLSFIYILATYLIVSLLLLIKHPRVNNDVASTIQTFVFIAGLLFTYISLTFIEKSNEFIKSQTTLTSSLLEIEKRRDLQANFISAWLVLDVETVMRPSEQYQRFTAGLYFLNSSNLPVYNLEIKFTIKDQETIQFLPIEIGLFNSPLRVMPPNEGKSYLWGLNGTDRKGGSISVGLNPDSDNQFSKVSLVDHNLTLRMFERLGVRISFRCADGSIYERDELGILHHVN